VRSACTSYYYNTHSERITRQANNNNNNKSWCVIFLARGPNNATLLFVYDIVYRLLIIVRYAVNIGIKPRRSVRIQSRTSSADYLQGDVFQWYIGVLSNKQNAYTLCVQFSRNFFVGVLRYYVTDKN